MSDTLGGIVDKLITVDLKMWNAQDVLYEIRHMTFEQFKTKYWENEKGAELIWEILKKACDLNIQRNQLIDEFDERVVELIKDAISGKDLDDGRNIQRKHKTV